MQTVETKVRHAPVAILGGGISGLALAAWLQARGIAAHVFEKTDRPGGVIGGQSVNGFLFERGPNTLLDKSTLNDEFLDLVGLNDEAIRVPLSTQKRYIWHGGRLHNVPTGPGALMKTKLFPLRAKLCVLGEPRVKPVEQDETLKEFFTRRFGAEICERAVTPMVSGIWAGDPARLSVEATFPILKRMERNAGSVIKGFMKKKKAGPGEEDAPKRKKPSLLTFPGGLERLPHAIAEKIGDAWHSQSPVARVEPIESGGCRLRLRDEDDEAAWTADRVVLCGEADETARWIENFEPDAAARLEKLHYCSLAVVGLGVERTSLDLPEGFGFLAARDQGLRVLGAIINSNFLEDRAPEGCAALTVMVGGDLDPEGSRLDDAALLDLVRRDLKTALRWNGAAKAETIIRWPRAIPQYFMGHGQFEAALEAVERRRPGLAFFGNWRGGVSLGDRIERARELAQSLETELKQKATA